MSEANGNTTDNLTVSNNTTETNGTSSDGGGDWPPIFKDPFPMHSLLWKLGIIFVIFGLLVFCTFIFLIILKYTRRKMLVKCRRRRPRGPFAYENHQNAMDNESDAGTPCGEQVITPQKDDSRGHVRRRSRDEESPNELDDTCDSMPTGIHKLDRARLAFQEDSNHYPGYDATRDTMKV